jgi:hypothetical protein
MAQLMTSDPFAVEDAETVEANITWKQTMATLKMNMEPTLAVIKNVSLLK